MREDGSTGITKHFEMGRGTWELAIFANDGRTAFVAISADRSERQSARFYTLELGSGIWPVCKVTAWATLCWLTRVSRIASVLRSPIMICQS